MRINARLDKEMTGKFRHLLRVTRQSATEVIKRAIEAYHSNVAGAASQPRAANLLKLCGFVGCAAADRKLSSNYKDILTRSLRRKV